VEGLTGPLFGLLVTLDDDGEYRINYGRATARPAQTLTPPPASRESGRQHSTSPIPTAWLGAGSLQELLNKRSMPDPRHRRHSPSGRVDGCSQIGCSGLGVYWLLRDEFIRRWQRAA
jgi:hypothetical protein